jgi:hypothetical protein
MVRGHVTGNIPCADGRPWGNHWQSAWWTAKMAVGARLIWPWLTENERVGVERVIAHEADRHLPRRAPGGAVSNTRSEENAWDTEVLAAAAAYLPRQPRAGLWRQKLVEFALNALSAPQDATDSSVVDGRPLRDHVYTANIHSDFTIENHGAYHTCYMACPLHSLTWGYYALASEGRPVPDAQFHHFRDVWAAMKPTFLRRHFAYPAGNDWPRYAYGQSFIMPALVVLQHRYRDADARAIEAARVRCFETEQRLNADGTFFGRRFTRNVMMDRFAEYETDAYANLGLAYLLHRLLGPSGAALAGSAHPTIRGGRASQEAGLAVYRGETAFASMAWRRLDGPYPTAHFIPLAADDLPEWGPNNLVGRLAVEGVHQPATLTTHHSAVTPRGLDCHGTLQYRRRDGTPLYTHRIRFVADCDRGLATVTYTFEATSSIVVQSVEGLRLHVANDVMNGYRRVWAHGARPFVEVFAPPATPIRRETIRSVPLAGRCVSVDGELGIADLGDDGGFVLRISDRANGPWGSIHYSVLDCPPVQDVPRTYAAGDTILRGQFLIVAGDLNRTRAIAERRRQGDDLTSLILQHNTRMELR